MNKYTKVLKLLTKNITNIDLEKLKFDDEDIKLIICYISPNLDFSKITKDIKSFFGKKVTVLATLTAGELCTFNLDKVESNIYLETNDNWESIVLQSFSSSMIKSAELLTVDLECEDLKNNQEILSTSQRTQVIANNINNLKIKTKIDYKDTLAFTIIDGLSKSESFFIDAIYRTGKFQCQLIGGSSGGKLDFQNTFIFNNDKVVSNVAVIVLLKLKKNIKFGILKSQNFKQLKESFEVLDCSVTQRYVKTVLDKKTNSSVNIIDYLSKIFNCSEDQLENKLLNFVFGIVINDEPFIKSISSIDLINRRVYFYCDVDFGDELYLFKTIDFVKKTKNDYDKFLENKSSKPFTGILNDCILRRISNSDNLNDLDCFSDVPLTGFSTFGELLGVNINQTLTAIFFFEVSKNEPFYDRYMDNFINNYANFKLFFNQRELNGLKSTEIKKLNITLEDELDKQTKELKKQLRVVKESEKKQDELFIQMGNAKEEIESSHKHTKDSIEYAALIQGALIPNNQLFINNFKDYFVIWEPKDTVGGDIYLFEELRDQDEYLLMFIDCTGHGVPGAFVTMLVKAVEREVISKIMHDKNIEVSPAWIMGYFNKTLKKLLKQENIDSLSNAGWDGGIIYYNRRTQILKFAGAETPLFYVDTDGTFNIIKGNRYSVGYKKCDSNYQYKETILEVKEGMKFYCTTDGYLDQNGGEKDFPFGKKRFGNIIKQKHNENMIKQQSIFLNEMMEYEDMIPNNDRNDDMTVIAFEIAETSNRIETILEYEGVLTQGIISHSMDIIEHNISNIAMNGNISTIVIELTQNMMKYSKSHDLICRDIRPAGLIEVQKDKDDVYYVRSKNILSIEDKNKIEPKLIEIQSLDKAGIKKRYRELRRSGENTHENGGGIGFYLISKFATSIEYEFKDINDEKFNFEFKVMIKK